MDNKNTISYAVSLKMIMNIDLQIYVVLTLLLLVQNRLRFDLWVYVVSYLNRLWIKKNRYLYFFLIVI